MPRKVTKTLPKSTDWELTTEQAAELAGVTPQAIRMWVNRGLLTPCRKDRGKSLYHALDVAKANRATCERARRVLHH